jgi:hypothetical protein
MSAEAWTDIPTEKAFKAEHTRREKICTDKKQKFKGTWYKHRETPEGEVCYECLLDHGSTDERPLIFTDDGHAEDPSLRPLDDVPRDEESPKSQRARTSPSARGSPKTRRLSLPNGSKGPTVYEYTNKQGQRIIADYLDPNDVMTGHVSDAASSASESPFKPGEKVIFHDEDSDLDASFVSYNEDPEYCVIDIDGYHSYVELKKLSKRNRSRKQKKHHIEASDSDEDFAPEKEEDAPRNKSPLINGDHSFVELSKGNDSPKQKKYKKKHHIEASDSDEDFAPEKEAPAPRNKSPLTQQKIKDIIFARLAETELKLVDFRKRWNKKGKMMFQNKKSYEDQIETIKSNTSDSFEFETLDAGDIENNIKFCESIENSLVELQRSSDSAITLEGGRTKHRPRSQRRKKKKTKRFWFF